MSRSVNTAWDLIQAASHGDRHAFNEICEDLREPVMHAVQRQLELEAQHVTAARVADITERVCETAFRDLSEKPRDWSMYGWMRWLVTQELARKGERLGERIPAALPPDARRYQQQRT